MQLPAGRADSPPSLYPQVSWAICLLKNSLCGPAAAWPGHVPV